MYAALENMGNLVDYGELAARLGSVVTFNREGNIVFWDNFENTPLKWDILKTIGTETAKYAKESSLSGGQSVKMSTVADISSDVTIERYFPIFCEKKQGIEAAIKGSETPAVIYFLFWMVYKGLNYYFRIKIDSNANVLQYYDNNPYWVTFEDNLGLAQADYLFHHFKLVIDLETKRYVRFIMDRREYTIDDGVYTWSAGNENDYFRASIMLKNVSASVCDIYVDNFVLTQNEP